MPIPNFWKQFKHIVNYSRKISLEKNIECMRMIMENLIFPLAYCSSSSDYFFPLDVASDNNRFRALSWMIWRAILVRKITIFNWQNSENSEFVLKLIPPPYSKWVGRNLEEYYWLPLEFYIWPSNIIIHQGFEAPASAPILWHDFWVFPILKDLSLLKIFLLEDTPKR